MADNCLYVVVGGVFAFNDSDLSLASICEVFNEFPMCVEGVPDRPDEVRCVMFGRMPHASQSRKRVDATRFLLSF